MINVCCYSHVHNPSSSFGRTPKKSNFLSYFSICSVRDSPCFFCFWVEFRRFFFIPPFFAGEDCSLSLYKVQTFSSSLSAFPHTWFALTLVYHFHSDNRSSQTVYMKTLAFQRLFQLRFLIRVFLLENKAG